MHMRCLILSLFFLVSATKLGAQSFDHYVLSLSWSPSWCATEGKERGSEQCSNSADFGWILHGLWPQTIHPGRATVKVGMLHPAGV